jgi:hypothetical protein
VLSQDVQQRGSVVGNLDDVVVDPEEDQGIS